MIWSYLQRYIKTLRHLFSRNIKTYNLYFCLKCSLKYRIKLIHFFPYFLSHSTLFHFMPFRTIPPSTINTNTTIITQTSLSITTLSPTSILLTHNKLLYFMQICPLSLFLISHASKQYWRKIFSRSLRKK